MPEAHPDAAGNRRTRTARTRNARRENALLTPPATQPLLPSMRGLLFASAALVFLAGVQLFVFPTRTAEYFSWTIASPMTAVFLGAAYWSAVALELSGARARCWSEARLAVPTVFVFTCLTLAATLLHLGLFHFGAQFSVATRLVAWAWLAIYIVVPILMIVITVHQRRLEVPDPARVGRLPAGIRIAVLVLMLVLGAAGLTLFLAPALSPSWWPWQLTPLTSRAVGAWLISLGVAAGHGAIENDVVRLRPIGTTAVVFATLEGTALLRYGQELDWSTAAAYGYLAVLVALLLLGLWTLGAGRGTRSGQDAGIDEDPTD